MYKKMKPGADRDKVEAMAAETLKTPISYFNALADYLTIFSAEAAIPGMALEANSLRDKARQVVRVLSCE
jgi:DNA/RNA-binding domain of Phe-tRNA-synthetase-like protein